MLDPQQLDCAGSQLVLPPFPARPPQLQLRKRKRGVGAGEDEDEEESFNQPEKVSLDPTTFEGQLERTKGAGKSAVAIDWTEVSLGRCWVGAHARLANQLPTMFPRFLNAQIIIRLPGTYDPEAEAAAEEEAARQRQRQRRQDGGSSDDQQQQQPDWGEDEEGGAAAADGGGSEGEAAGAAGGGGGEDEWGGRANANATLRDVFGDDDDDI